MKWEEVRDLYPNQFVKFQVLKSHVEDDIEYVDKLALIVPIEEKHATKEMLNSREDILVYQGKAQN